MAHAFLDEKTLEALVFERSKAWSSKMKEFASLEDGMELNVSEFEDLFHDEHQDPDLEDVAQEALEVNVPDEAKLEMGHINGTSAAELTLALCASKDKESKTKIEEILKQTVPVVEEHNRKWREAGMDRILDTFDEKQIEHHVGPWMRRHSSAYLEASPPKYPHAHHSSISDESYESMQSIDTARCIQCRRRNVHISNKTSHMTTIKTYRKHCHKRDELRAKYAYGDEQEHRHHMRAVLLRRREREPKLASRPMKCVCSRGHHMRRKNLRKPRINSRTFDSASSSEDDTSFGDSDCSSRWSHYALSRRFHKCCPYGWGQRKYHQRKYHQRKYHQRQVASRNMHTMRSHHTFDKELDLRPRLLENECSCSNSNSLCSSVIHIANSSTEEWVVENRGSHLTQETQDKTRKQKQQPMDAKKIRHRSKGNEQKPHSSKATSASKIVSSKEKYMKTLPNEDEDIAVTKKVTTPKTAGKITHPTSTAKNSLPQIQEENPTASLGAPPTNAPIEATGISTPLESPVKKYPKSANGEIGLAPSPPKENEPVCRPIADEKALPLQSIKKIRVFVKKLKIPKSILNKEILEKDSTQPVSEKRTRGRPRRGNNIRATGKPSTSRVLRSQRKKTTSYLTKLDNVKEEEKETSNKQSQSPAENSKPVLNNQGVVCNSTAMANDTACRRVPRSRRGVKKAAAVSSTEKSGDPDCTVDTSTASERPASEPLPYPANVRITERGILLHRSSAPGGANFTLTEQVLGKIIGERWARKYLKYHIGSRSFDSQHSVYFQPTPHLAAALRSPQGAQKLGNSSASDDDIFEKVDRYGTVYSILEKNSGDK